MVCGVLAVSGSRCSSLGWLLCVWASACSQLQRVKRLPDRWELGT
jgi:hypothetical protein